MTSEQHIKGNYDYKVREDKGLTYIHFICQQVLQKEGLGKFCDPDFVRATQRELAEAINLTQEEMDMAAHQILQQERRQSMPHMCLETPEPEESLDDAAADDKNNGGDPLTMRIVEPDATSTPRDNSENLEQTEASQDATELHSTEDTSL